MSSRIATYTQGWFDPIHPSPLDVNILDIAHALATTNRFTGHARIPYSVAEHCVRMSYITPPELALDALMHDVGETYLPDMAAPLKRTPQMEGFCGIEDQVEAACRAALGLFGAAHDPRVKEFDNIMLVTEARDLGLRWWKWRYDTKPLPFRREGWARVLPWLSPGIRPWSWRKAKRRFLKRYKELRA